MENNKKQRNFFTKIRSLLKAKEFIVLQFFFFLIIFNLPFLLGRENMPISFYFNYYYSVWGIAIFVLFLISISTDNSE